METKPKRKRGPKHRGVTILKPSEKHRTGWALRYRDPDSGKLKKEKFPDRITTEEARAEWAALKLAEITKRRNELDLGAPRARGVSLEGAGDSYFETAGKELGEKTRKTYKRDWDAFVTWASGRGVKTCDQLTRPTLIKWRGAIIGREKKRQGARANDDEARNIGAPLRESSTNCELRSVRTILRHLIDLDLCARLTHEDVRRGLKRLEVEQGAIRILKQPQIRQLLEAALLHDEDARKPRRSRPRPPVAAFTLYVLFTGMRLEEAVSTEWSMVNLDALDDEGHTSGEIELPPRVTKTNRFRVVSFDVSPSLRELLQRVKPQDAEGALWFSYPSAVYGARRLYEFGAPKTFTWRVLRATCGSFLTNAKGIYGGASVYRSAQRLGHSVEVAQKHYLDAVKGIPREARTLEAAMGIEDLVAKVLASITPPSAQATSGSKRG